MHIVVSDGVEALGCFFIDIDSHPPAIIVRGREHNLVEYDTFPFSRVSRELAGRMCRRNPGHVLFVCKGRTKQTITVERIQPESCGGWLWRNNGASYAASDLATAIEEVFIAVARAEENASVTTAA